MALKWDDRIVETTAVVGTGPATLLGAESQCNAFASALADGDTTDYEIKDQSGSNWETGLGTYAAAGPTLTRTTVYRSSNGNAAVNFGAGTKDVFIALPAKRVTDLLGAKAANVVLAGPSSGGAATPAYRALVAADVPALAYDAAGAAAAAQAASQPLDTDLTAIAALGTTAFGRGGLNQANAAGFRSYIGAGVGNALTSGTLAQFAATTSAQLAGVISDATGTGFAVFSASPALTGVPTAPTASNGTNTTQLATTAFVLANAGGSVGGADTQVLFNDGGAEAGNAALTFTKATGVVRTTQIEFSEANTGMNRLAAGRLGLMAGGSTNLVVGGTQIEFWTSANMVNSMQYRWSSTSSGNSGPDTGLSRVAPQVIGGTDGGGGKGWLQNTAGVARVTTPVTNATATMSSGVLSDLTLTLIAGRKYVGRLVLFVKNSTSAEGLQVDFNGGACSATSVQFGVAGVPAGGGTAATVGTPTSTALAMAVTLTALGATVDLVVTIEFEILVNAGGTLIPRVAEVSHTSGTVTVETGSYLALDDSPN